MRWNKIEYKDIFRVETLAVPGDQSYANKLLKNGWQLLKVVQNKNGQSEYASFVLGASKEVYENFNLAIIKQQEREKKFVNR